MPVKPVVAACSSSSARSRAGRRAAPPCRQTNCSTWSSEDVGRRQTADEELEEERLARAGLDRRRASRRGRAAGRSRSGRGGRSSPRARPWRGAGASRRGRSSPATRCARSPARPPSSGRRPTLAFDREQREHGCLGRRQRDGCGLHSRRRLLQNGVLDENRDRRALRLEDGFLDVAEILAVDLERQRAVAADLDPVEVVADEELRRARMAAQQRVRRPEQRASRECEPARRSRGRARSRRQARAASGCPSRTCTGSRSRRTRTQRDRGPRSRAPARRGRGSPRSTRRPRARTRGRRAASRRRRVPSRRRAAPPRRRCRRPRRRRSAGR